MSGGIDERSALLTHLLELRRALIICGITVAVLFCVIFGFLIDYIMTWLTAPIQARGIEIIYTAMSEALLTKFKVSVIASIIAASPVIIWQIWSFVKPGLYPDEQKKCRYLFMIMLALFLLGVSFCYLVVYSFAVDFFLIQGTGFAAPLLSLDSYISFLLSFVLPFGISFQLPAALYLTTRIGWTNYAMLAAKRKYVLLGIFVIAAVLTPPDVVSQVALGVPLYVLYEAGIQVSRFAAKH